MVAAVIAAFYQSALIGWWRGEAKYKGRYTNSWRAEMRAYEYMGFDGGNGYLHFWFVRSPTKWENLLEILLPGKLRPGSLSSPPLQNGDPESVPVLEQLLQAPEANVRILAAIGLEQIGPPAQAAVPTLLAVLHDEDREGGTSGTAGTQGDRS
jgi:hypothetical protein